MTGQGPLPGAQDTHSSTEQGGHTCTAAESREDAQHRARSREGRHSEEDVTAQHYRVRRPASQYEAWTREGGAVGIHPGR